jgi:rare lipoprotein A
VTSTPRLLLLLLSGLTGVTGLLGTAGCGGRGDPSFRPPQTPTTKAEARQGEGEMDFTKAPAAPDVSAHQVGMATWYGAAFAGRKTANGERFDPNQHTAAHRKLPFNTWVEVRRPDTGRTVRVRINDRGPWGDDKRIIDLSRRAAEELDLVRDGVVRVELRVVSGP